MNCHVQLKTYWNTIAFEVKTGYKTETQSKKKVVFCSYRLGTSLLVQFAVTFVLYSHQTINVLVDHYIIIIILLSIYKCLIYKIRSLNETFIITEIWNRSKFFTESKH